MSTQKEFQIGQVELLEHCNFCAICGQIFISLWRPRNMLSCKGQHKDMLYSKVIENQPWDKQTDKRNSSNIGQTRQSAAGLVKNMLNILIPEACQQPNQHLGGQPFCGVDKVYG